MFMFVYAIVHTEMNPMDYIYRCLRCEIQLLDENETVAQYILRYVSATYDGGRRVLVWVWGWGLVCLHFCTSRLLDIINLIILIVRNIII